MTQLLLNLINVVLMLAVAVLICLQGSPEGEPLIQGYHGLVLAVIALTTCALWNLVGVVAQAIIAD